MITRNIETDVASSGTIWSQPTPLGRPNDGRPLGTSPRVETPCDSRSNAQLIAIAPTTATSPPGIAGIHRSKTTRVAMTPKETASVAPDVSGISFSVSKNFTAVPLTLSSDTSGDATPSMPANCPSATWIPTPVRKPMSTVREMKSARKPSRATRARIRSPPVISAARLAYASHSGVLGWSPETLRPAIPA